MRGCRPSSGFALQVARSLGAGVNVVGGISNHGSSGGFPEFVGTMKNSKVVENILRFVARLITIKLLSIQNKECGHSWEDSLDYLGLIQSSYIIV
jgi:hypothetical protein